LNKVAVVILNWNGKDFLEKFLPAVIQYSSQEAEIYVIDNASSDDSVSFIQSNYPAIKIIQNSENFGFAGGYNHGLKQIESKYYVLLNSDVEVTENWITPVIDLMENDSSIAACQPKIKDYNNKDYYEYAGAAGGFIDKYGFPFCRGRVFDSLERDTGQYNNITEVFWASGACMFINSKKYHETGGLDEFFFAHMEEIDLCWRLKNKGYKIMYSPHSTIYHIGGATLNKINPQKTFLNFRNSLLMLHKNLPKRKRFSVLFIRLSLDGVAGAKFLLSGKPLHTWAILKSHFSFYNSLKQNKLKRVKGSSNNSKEILDKSIVIGYFMKKRKTFGAITK
jgi:GT2 family glycosyltransferase